MNEVNINRQLTEARTRIEFLEAALHETHEELEKGNSELLQLTLELEDRVEERTRALRESERELREHRDRLQEMVEERTEELKSVNTKLRANLGKLQASEERFRSLVLTIPDIVYRIDRNGNFTFINDAIQRLGYEPEELYGKHFSEIILPEDVESISRFKLLPRYKGKVTGDKNAPKLFDERRTGNRRTTDLEVRLVSKGRKLKRGLLEHIGKEVTVVEVNSAGMYGINPATKMKIHIGTVGVIRDITERKKLEEGLRKARDELENRVQERTADLLKVNRSLERQIAERERVEKELKRLMDQLKDSQAQLIHAEKMGALGTMTAGIAHELNNPMMGILNFTEYCLKYTLEDDKRHAVLQDCERETRRCIDIVRNLLTFSRMDKGSEEEYQRESISMIFDRVLKLLSYRIEKENVAVTHNFSEKVPDIRIKVSNIQQVFLNIIGNALDALKENKKKEIHLNLRPEDEFVRVTITDSGCGIEPESLPKIFDPFFTTKPPGKGTGLGLSLCHSIVDAHGGKIICESEVGKGTRFDVFLPMEISSLSEKMRGKK
jgi:PAS domain S-box-containing protein